MTWNLNYELRMTNPETGRLWVMFHGFGFKRRFPNVCLMHERENVLYMKAPDWNRRIADCVAEDVSCVIADFEEHPVKSIYVAGNSDGATWSHLYAKLMLEDYGLPVRCVVHYAGLWRGIVAPCPLLAVVGKNEPFQRIRKGTAAAVDAYGKAGQDFQLMVTESGHVWDAEYNARILNTVNEMVSWRMISDAQESTGQETTDNRLEGGEQEA